MKNEKKREASNSIKLRLYVTGATVNSVRAMTNLRDICKKYFDGRYSLEVIDLLINPKLARNDQIFAVPTLVRKTPEPVKRIIGNLSDEKQVLAHLSLAE